jgi:hypothetical protein
LVTVDAAGDLSKFKPSQSLTDVIADTAGTPEGRVEWI